MDQGAWQATVHGVAKESDTTEQLNHNNLAVYTNTGGPRKHHNEKKGKHENCRHVYGLVLYV